MFKENAEYGKLLEEIAKTFNERISGRQNNNTDPNVFEILQIENKEVLFCRFLCYILDPGKKLNKKDSEDNNSIPVRNFLKTVLFENSSEPEKISIDKYTAFTINLEERTDEARRVDIVIRAQKNQKDKEEFVFPIEVKIGAEDQKAQLYDYYQFYFNEETGTNKNQPQKIVYYMTPTGKAPSDKSTKSGNGETKQLGKGDYECIGFQKISEWLEDLKTDYYKEDFSKLLIDQFKMEVDALTEKERIKEVLFESLEQVKQDDEDDENIRNLLIAILQNKDEIVTKLRQHNLKNRIKLAAEYEFSEEITEADKEKDQRCVLKIIRKNNKKAVAWIAIANNLYMIAEKLKDEKNAEKGDRTRKWEKAKDKENYYWRYISPNGRGERYEMRNVDSCWDTKTIKIEDALAEIDQDYSPAPIK